MLENDIWNWNRSNIGSKSKNTIGKPNTQLSTYSGNGVLQEENGKEVEEGRRRGLAGQSQSRAKGEGLVVGDLGGEKKERLEWKIIREN